VRHGHKNRTQEGGGWWLAGYICGRAGGTGLEVRDTVVEVKGSIALEGRKLGSYEGGDEIGAANGLASQGNEPQR
jgi:hypothetical protein